MEIATRVERLNQAVRGIVTLALCAGFLYLAVAGRISGDVYTAVFTGIVGFWFGTRGQEPPKVSQAAVPGNGLQK